MSAANDPAQTPTQVQLREIEAQLAGLRAELADLSAAVLLGPPANEPQAAVSDEVPEPVHPSVEAWVEDYFCAVFARPVGGEIRWCLQWRDHPEAVTRLEALWRSWEALRLDPNLGVATWLTNYLDPQLAALLSRSGTFARCTSDRHASPPRMATAQPC
jgi:Domain of unknown function (DUF4913)